MKRITISNFQQFICTALNFFELWLSLNYRQKDVLHLSCGFKFAWPRQAIGKVVKDEHDKAPSVDAVAHLLSETISGVRPFHELSNIQSRVTPCRSSVVLPAKAWQDQSQ
jgi:hypothetical protein